MKPAMSGRIGRRTTAQGRLRFRLVIAAQQVLPVDSKSSGTGVPAGIGGIAAPTGGTATVGGR
eukprot:10465708-Alexandrium_andersonii.AAC.1